MPDPTTKWESVVTRAMRACVRVFGEGQTELGANRITYNHTTAGVSRFYDGIYDAMSEAIDLDTGSTIMTNQPRVSFALQGMYATPIKGDTINIRGIWYAVVETDFDGQGTVTCRLHRTTSPSGGGGGGGVID